MAAVQINLKLVPVLKITIGEGGEFAILTEALEYAAAVVHNLLIIKMLEK